MILHKVTFKNKEIAYQVSGSGLPVVLLHGYMMSSEIWGEFSLELANDFKVIAIDLPGHGRSASFPPIHSMDLMADAVVAVLKQENIDRASIIGHSMGGYVAMALLEKYANYVSDLVLLNTYPSADTPEKTNVRKRIIKLVQKGKKDLFLGEAIKDLIPDTLNQSVENLRNSTLKISSQQSSESIVATTLGMKERPDRSFLLKNLSIPSIWIEGKNDNQNNPEVTFQKAKELNILRPKIINTGHMSFLEDPQNILKLIKKVLPT